MDNFNSNIDVVKLAVMSILCEFTSENKVFSAFDVLEKVKKEIEGPLTSLTIINYYIRDSFSDGDFAGMIIRDYGKDGALIQIEHTLTSEEQAQIDEAEKIVAGTYTGDWFTLGTTHPPIQLLIRKPGTTKPTPQVISD